MESTEKLIIVMRIIVIGFMGALLFHSMMSMTGYTYPLNTFLFKPDDRFKDFLNLYDITKNLNPYFSDRHNLAIYFPITYLTIFPLTLLPKTLALVVYYYIFCRFLIWFIQYQARSISIRPPRKIIILFSILIFFSFPILFCLDRGNIDGLIFVILSLFIIAFINKKYYLAAIPLAFAAGMKGYPLVFIVLFIKEKRWKEAIFCLTLLALITLIALISFSPHGIGRNIHQFSSILSAANNVSLLNDGNLNFSSSLFSFVKMIAWYLPPYYHNYANLQAYQLMVPHLQIYYALLTFFMFGLITLYIIFIKTAFWKQVMLLTCSMILFPYISADYKLIFLFIPFLLFITTKQKEKFDYFYTALFALLFIPKNYFIFKGPLYYFMPNVSIYSMMDLMNVVMMVMFMVEIVIESLSSQGNA